uniref:CBP80/20-dependent translation initiation factor n=1 Tax=Tetraodon nigroviridis TaxID=99883 RepID=H3DN46_TETNG
MENSSVASASSEAGSTRSQEIEELERFIDSYVLEYQVQGILGEKTDGELDNGSKAPQWTDDFNNKKDGSWTSSRGRGSIRPNGNRDGSLDILGTDIWAANTMDSHGCAGWDVQPEKLNFSHFHRKHIRGTPKHLPHINRDGMNKNRLEEDDGIDMNDIERFLPHLHTVFPPLPNEAEIAHTKKLFRRRRNDRRRQSPGVLKLHQHQTSSSGSSKYNRDKRQQRHQGGGGGHGPRQGGHSQNRRWHPSQKGQGQGQTTLPGDKGASPRTNRETEAEPARGEEDTGAPVDIAATCPGQPPESKPATNASPVLMPNKEAPPGSEKTSEGQPEKPKISLLQSSKERLRRRLKDKEDTREASSSGDPQSMDRLVDLLNNMRSNSSGVEQQLVSFMEEVQCSARSEETLAQVVHTIYATAVSDRSFAATAAKLCDKMALFIVDGTKFRSLLLNMLQRDFCRREQLQQADIERWLGFITFLCEVFGTMRSSSGEPFRVLVCPIYTCLRELLQSTDVKEDAVLCCSMELQSMGRLLEEQLPEMMTELLAAVRDKMLCPAESQLTRSLLMEVIELHAHCWNPLEALTTQYYNRTIQKLTT